MLSGERYGTMFIQRIFIKIQYILPYGIKAKRITMYIYTYDRGNICMSYIDGERKGSEACYDESTGKVRGHKGGMLSKIV